MWPASIPQPTEPRITCAIVDAAAKVRDLNFKYMAEGKGATVTPASAKTASPSATRTVRAKGADKVFQRIYDRAI